MNRATWYTAFFPAAAIGMLALVVPLSGEAKPESSEKSPAKPAADVLKGVDLSGHIYGEEVDERDLKGKVVFLEYWGVNCGPCRQSFPSLVKLQNELADTGKFTVFASHVQGMSDAVPSFLQQMQVNFPVYQQARFPAAPCGRAIPSAHLISGNGEVVASGLPWDLHDKAKRLVSATPHPLLRGIEIKHCVAESKAITKTKGIAPAVKALEAKAAKEGPQAEEAGKLLSNVKEMLGYQIERGRKMLEKRPTKAVPYLSALGEKAAGLSEGNEALALVKDLKSNRDFQILVKAADLAERNRGRKNWSLGKSSPQTRKELQGIIDAGKARAGVIAEAKDLLAEP